MNKGATVLADDLVIALLHFLPKFDGIRKFSADRQTIHVAFFKLRQKNQKVLDPIRFRDRYSFPESSVLDQALSNLESSGLLERRNETPRAYFVLGAIDDAFEKSVCQRLTKKGIDEVKCKSLARRFANLAPSPT